MALDAALKRRKPSHHSLGVFADLRLFSQILSFSVLFEYFAVFLPFLLF